MRPQTSASSAVARRIRIPETGFAIDEECTAIVNCTKAFDVMMPANREKNMVARSASSSTAFKMSANRKRDIAPALR